MSLLDYIVLLLTVGIISVYGLWRNRRSSNIAEYLLADRSLPWYTVALSIVATQASAITFLSAPGQAYFDGMRFVQFYFGLPLAMIVVAYVFLPRFYGQKVLTAYELVENKFDVRVRVMMAVIFLIQRGLAAGLVISAPSIILSEVLGWNFFATVLLMGGVVVLYTTIGGAAAVSQTQFQQMLIILVGMAIAGYLVVVKLNQHNISFGQAVDFASAAGKMNVIDTKFDWHNKYNVWSGLIGGFFLFLAYFGTDQSQVERYISAKSMKQARMGLLFNGLFKIPMQFCILFIGVLLFVLFQLDKPPVYFNETVANQTLESSYAYDYSMSSHTYDMAYDTRKQAALNYFAGQGNISDWQNEHLKVEAARADVVKVVSQAEPTSGSDKNYLFLYYVLHDLPHGLIGLLIAVIFFASMSTTAAEINALASVSVVDIYKRLIKPKADDQHYVTVSRWLTVGWAAFAVVFVLLFQHASTLIEIINELGSLFYGTMLGIFLLVFFAKNISSNAVLLAVVLAEIVVFYAYYHEVPYLWLPLLGCLVTIVGAYALSLTQRVLKL